jgi:hypothetical protein
MFWLLFTLVDLYVGVVVLDQMMPSLPPEKQGRARIATRILIAATAIVALFTIVKWVRR